MIPRRVRLASISALALASGVIGGACILVDPPAEIPTLGPHRPIIVRGSIVPPTTELLLPTWPLEFDVPVEVLDPTQDVAWQAFIDDGFKGFGKIGPDPASQDAGIRQIFARFPQPAVEACHTIEIIVANSFPAPRTPDPLGGDSAVWFYSPTGNLSACPVFDAGPIIADGAFVDVPDAGE